LLSGQNRRIPHRQYTLFRYSISLTSLFASLILFEISSVPLTVFLQSADRESVILSFSTFEIAPTGVEQSAFML
jgi:hypothetical protein